MDLRKENRRYYELCEDGSAQDKSQYTFLAAHFTSQASLRFFVGVDMTLTIPSSPYQDDLNHDIDESGQHRSAGHRPEGVSALKGHPEGPAMRRTLTHEAIIVGLRSRVQK